MSVRIKKTKLNLSIDLLMFVIMISMAGIGFLIKYVLLPGFKRNDIYGNDVELYYWGLDRHQWGTIHLILSLFFLFLLLLHIVFHWNQIVSIFKTMVSAREWRIAISSTLVLFTLVFVTLPFFIHPEVEAAHLHHANRNNPAKDNNSDLRLYRNRNEALSGPAQTQGVSATEDSGKPSAAKTSQGILSNKEASTVIQTTVSAVNADERNYMHQNHSEDHQGAYNHQNQSEIEIYGYMTLNEVARHYHVTAQELASCIHIPDGNNNERLGRLKKRYHFEIRELRDYIESKQSAEL